MRPDLHALDVVSAGPLPARSVAWQGAHGGLTLTVVTKATFVLTPGDSPLAEVQDEPNELDAYWNDDEQRSLAAATDLLPFKRRADVILVGHARAPGGMPVRQIVARLVVGEVDKAIAIHCERAFARDGSLREGVGFTRMPLRWERAAGGPDTDNPVGVRADAPYDARGLAPLPSLLPPEHYLVTRGEFIAPVGFGPIAPGWPSRQAKLHAGLAGWDYRHWYARPLPADLDPAFFNVAPADQQTESLRANERLLLENLHPEHARLATTLTPITPRMVVELAGVRPRDLGMRCDTLSIDTDRGTCSLTWRGQVPLDEGLALRRVVVTTGEAWRRTVTMTLNDPDPSPRAVVPFTQSPSAPPPPSPSTTPPAPAPIATSATALTGRQRTQEMQIGSAIPALPFRHGHSPLASPAPGAQGSPPPPPALDRPRELAPEDRTATITFTAPQAEAPRTPPPQAAPQAAPWTESAPDALTSTAPILQLPAFGPLPPGMTLGAVAPLPSLAPPVSAPEAAAKAQVAPPMLGPIPVSKPVDADLPPDSTPTAPTLPAAMEPAPPAPEAAPVVDIYAAYPLERCAAIDASIARRPEDKKRILKEHGLEADRWNELSTRRLGEVDAEANRGRNKLLAAYDAAYVAQLEAERGPLSPADHAKIQIAVERRTAGATLREMHMPEAALMRLRRVWLTRSAKEPALGAEYRAALRAALSD